MPLVQQSALSEPKWVSFKEWSGRSGHLRTETFETTGDSWRISWKTTGGDPDPLGSIGIKVRKTGDHLVTQASNLGQRVTSGTFIVRSTPGEHYLEIDSEERVWQVSVDRPDSG
jgi:hypothetical protein